MNKKIAAVVVAGLFAAPVSALAQSSVTISGVFKMSFENMKLSNFGGGVARAGNNSVYGVADDSSRIIFNVVEDLGGGLQAIGQLDVRFKPDDNQGPAAAQPSIGGQIAGGNSHVGLRSSSWGRIFFGRQDLHYFNTESNITSKANTLRSDPISMIAYAGAYAAAGATPAGGSGGVAMAGATRTQNVVHYTTPNWSGFTAIVAYSSSPLGSDSDLGVNGGVVGTRKGYAWNVNPNYAASNWQIGYSYWKSKPDLTGATATLLATNDQRADRLYGSYTFGFGLKLGLAWDKSRLNSNLAGGANIKTSDRQVWSIPIGYTFGNHNINFHYTWANSDKGTPAAGLNTKANMWAIGYAYDISKRTSVGLTYAQINNNTNAAYTFFTSASLGVNGAATPVNAGEDPKVFAATIRHAF